MDIESAVQWIQDFLNMPIFVYGTTTLTFGYVILLVLKWILPNNKIINNQESTIGILESENQILKETNAKLVADVEKLKKQMDVVLTSTQNKKYRQAKNIESVVDQVEKIQANVTEILKKTKKIKVKKGTTNNG